jgi:hypothetical protein
MPLTCTVVSEIDRLEALRVEWAALSARSATDEPTLSHLDAPAKPDQPWSMDFVSDALADGRVFRTLTSSTTSGRECVAIEADTSLGARGWRACSSASRSSADFPSAS